MKKVNVSLKTNDDIIFANGTDSLEFSFEANYSIQDIMLRMKNIIQTELQDQDTFVKKGNEDLGDWILNDLLYSLQDRIQLNLDEEGDLNNEFKMIGNLTLNVEISDFKPTVKNRRKP